VPDGIEKVVMKLFIIIFVFVFILYNLQSNPKRDLLLGQSYVMVSETDPPTNAPTYDIPRHHQEVYVFGAESSGTRFLSRGVAVLFRNKLRWNGESPACKVIGDNKVAHVSLPWGSTCNGVIKVTQDFDICHHTFNGRHFANITNMLSLRENIRAVLVFRNETFTIKSILKNHCFMGQGVAQMEYDMAISLMNDAISAYPGRVIVVQYESLGESATWVRIGNFLGIKNIKVPLFKNGNKLR
jgi:hypothetical protein